MYYVCTEATTAVSVIARDESCRMIQYHKQTATIQHNLSKGKKPTEPSGRMLCSINSTVATFRIRVYGLDSFAKGFINLATPVSWSLWIDPGQKASKSALAVWQPMGDNSGSTNKSTLCVGMQHGSCQSI
jgi:hypothetical protein